MFDVRNSKNRNSILNDAKLNIKMVRSFYAGNVFLGDSRSKVYLTFSDIPPSSS